MQDEATLFSTRKAWWYIPRPGVGFGGKGNQGAGYFTAPNPAFGATFTYYLKDGLMTLEEDRKKKEKDKSGDIGFPGWDEVDAEMTQAKPEIWLTVKDREGLIVRRIAGKTKRGFHRTAWDLRYPSPEFIKLDDVTPEADRFGNDAGFLAAPGTYTVTLSKVVDGVETQLSSPQKFEVVPLKEGVLKGKPIESVAGFWRNVEDFQRDLSALTQNLRKAQKRIAAMQIAYNRAKVPSEKDLNLMAHEIRTELLAIDKAMYGSPAKRSFGEKRKPTIQERLSHITTNRSTYGATAAQYDSFTMAADEYFELQKRFDTVMDKMDALRKELDKVGAPKVEGQ